ncbi:hypothetical protein C8F01DRAFT_1347822 [Mycena amicta]|nr:hypothetical protein C8F01DRAFT_1347822 [Mycena amicta]
MSRLELAKIPALVFYKDSLTTSRRTSPIAQLTCVGKPCKLFTPDVVRCESLGGAGTDIDWKCFSDLPEALRFGRVEVSCEGWSRAGDPFVLKGSCALEYRLVQVPGTLRNSDSDNAYGGTRRGFFDGVSQIVFMVIWIAVLALIVYSFVKSCMSPTQNRVGGAGARPDSRPGSDGWFPGGFHDNNSAPPPPYSKTNQQPDANQGWRPGFWTGTMLGGLGAHLLNRQNRAYDWERERRYRTPPPPPPSGGGLFQRRSTPRQYSSEDRGEGSSNLGAMRQSTGFGGSNVR